MSTEEVLDRTAERKAAGAKQTYPEHADKAKGGAAEKLPLPPILTANASRPKPSKEELRKSLALLKTCPDLGPKIPGPCASPLHRCNRFGDKTSKTGHCMDEQRACCDCAHHPANSVAIQPVKMFSTPPLTPLVLPASQSSRAIVTVVVGADAQQVHAISRPYHEEYARRLGADYVVLTAPPPAPEFPLSAKFRLGQVLGYYDRVVFLDADALPLPGCPDLFAEVRDDEFGFHDDLPGLTRMKSLSLIDEYHEVRATTGLPAGPCRFVANTGVLVFAREHRSILEPPTAPLPLRHCGEQNWYTARLHDAGARVRRLPADCNYQWWDQGQFRGLPKSAPVILHFSGIVPTKSNEERLKLMRAWAQRG
jgi:hypothetical protein